MFVGVCLRCPALPLCPPLLLLLLLLPWKPPRRSSPAWPPRGGSGGGGGLPRGRSPPRRRKGEGPPPEPLRPGPGWPRPPSAGTGSGCGMPWPAAPPQPRFGSRCRVRCARASAFFLFPSLGSACRCAAPGSGPLGAGGRCRSAEGLCNGREAGGEGTGGVGIVPASCTSWVTRRHA